MCNFHGISVSTVSQRILDRAEQRSKHLGISNTSKFPLAESNQTLSTNTSSNARKSPGRPKSTAKSPLKRSNDNNSNVVTFSSNNSGKSGEDSDKFDNISVEINITTDSNVGVGRFLNILLLKEVGILLICYW